MQTNTMRERVRLLLGQWGGWMLLLERLRREQAAARAWAAQEEAAAPRELLSKIDREIDDLMRLRAAMGDLVRRLSIQEQQILLMRYEENLNWVQIGRRFSYDERSVRRLEARAVDKIGRGLAPLPEPPIPGGGAPHTP